MEAENVDGPVLETAKNAEDEAKDEWLIGIDENAEKVELVKQRLAKIGDLSFLRQVKTLNFRWNLIKKIEGLANVGGSLVELVLVDNQVQKLENLDCLINLRFLDVSYNRISKLEGLEKLANLEELYLVHNKIAKIEGLEKLQKLRILELGDNRIQKIENLEGLTGLKELHLGANQIRKIENLGCLNNSLKTLTLLGNAITKIEGLDELENLETLSLAQNGIREIHNLENLQKLKILDLNDNILEKLSGIQKLQKLEKLWLRKFKDLTVEMIECELKQLPKLNHLVIEGSQLAKQPNYRESIIRILPRLKQLDSYPVWWIPGDPWQIPPPGSSFLF